MAAQQTSLIAYDELRRSGELSARQQQVLAIIRAHQPHGITIREIARILNTFPSNLTGAIDRLKGNPISNQPPLIAEGRVGKSPITGKASIFWVPAETHEIQQSLFS